MKSSLQVTFPLHFRLGLHHGLTGFPGLFLAAVAAQSFSLISTGYAEFFNTVWQALEMVIRLSTCVAFQQLYANPQLF